MKTHATTILTFTVAKFGRFDEILVGHNWFGTGAIRYIWRDLPGEPSTPQMVILRRDIRPADAGVNVGKETVVRRIVGATAIKEWVEKGVPLDTARSY